MFTEYNPEGGHSFSNATFSPNGKRILAQNGNVKLWDINKEKPKKVFKEIGDFPDYCNIISTCRLKDGKFLFITTDIIYSEINIWNGYNGKNIMSFYAKDKMSFRSVDISPCGDFLLATFDGNLAKIYDMKTQKLLKTFVHNYKPSFDGTVKFVGSGVFSPCGKFVLTGANDGKVRLWDVATEKCLQVFNVVGKNYTDRIDEVAFSPCGKFILASGYLKRITRIWKIGQKKAMDIFEDINKAVFSPDGKFLLTGSIYEKLFLWQISSEKMLRNEYSFEELIFLILLSKEGIKSFDSKITETNLKRILDNIDTISGGDPILNIQLKEKGFLKKAICKKYCLKI